MGTKVKANVLTETANVLELKENLAENKAAKIANAELSQTEQFKAFIIEAEKSESFKAAEKAAKSELRKFQAELYAKIYAPICEALIKHYFTGANDDEILAEISAYNQDTKNGTILISDESPEKFGENSVNTYNTENKTFFGYLFAPESAAKAARLVNYWVEYRRNIVDSLAAKVATNKANARKKAKAENSAVELLAAKFGMSVEQFNAIMAANMAK